MGLRYAIICIFNLCKWMLLAQPDIMQLADGESGSPSLPSSAVPAAHRSGPNPELMFGKPRFQVWLRFQLAV